MNDLLETEFFGLLVGVSQEVTNKKMQNAYGNFVVHTKTVGDSADYASALRTLNFARIELSAFENTLRNEPGEKRPHLNLHSKGIGVAQLRNRVVAS